MGHDGCLGGRAGRVGLLGDGKVERGGCEGCAGGGALERSRGWERDG